MSERLRSVDDLEVEVSQLTRQVESLTFLTTKPSKTDDDVTVYYWGLRNRGNYLKLLLLEAGVDFKSVSDSKTIRSMIRGMCDVKPENEQFPVFAVPICKINGILISQTSVCVRYIAKRYNLLPSDELDQVIADGVCHNIFDLNNDGHIFQTCGKDLKDFKAFYFTKNGRFQKWLCILNDFLKRNPKRSNNRYGSKYFFDGKITYVDIILFNCFEGFEELLNQDGQDRFNPLLSYYPELYDLWNRLKQKTNFTDYIKQQIEQKVNWYPKQFPFPEKIKEFATKLKQIKPLPSNPDLEEMEEIN